jgi:hypothetical protein
MHDLGAAADVARAALKSVLTMKVLHFINYSTPMKLIKTCDLAPLADCEPAAYPKYNLNE